MAVGLLLIWLQRDWSIIAGWVIVGVDACMVAWFFWWARSAGGKYRATTRHAALADDHRKAEALLAIVQEVYDGGRDIIGPGWTVLDKMAILAAANDVDGMVKYFENCKRSYRGQRVRHRLERAGRKSLESEEARFMTLVREP